ncbi:MAG: helix-turn-helix domain-containing protein [Burkholderiales bacterium]|jgi:ribosome-binding protein aMBF1 (putative translation factor)
MSSAKLKRLKATGWNTGSATEFLQLRDEEAMLVELKLMLTDAIKASRQKRGLSQTDLARKMGSSQSRVAKIEAGDPSVSLDLIMRAFFATGATWRELQRAVGAGEKLAA